MRTMLCGKGWSEHIILKNQKSEWKQAHKIKWSSMRQKRKESGPPEAGRAGKKISSKTGGTSNKKTASLT